MIFRVVFFIMLMLTASIAYAEPVWLSKGYANPPSCYVAQDANGKFCIECDAEVLDLYNNSTYLGTLEGPMSVIGADVGNLFHAKKADIDTILALDMAWFGRMYKNKDYRIHQIDVYNSYNDEVGKIRIDGMLIKKLNDDLLTKDQLFDLLIAEVNVRSDISTAANGEFFIAGGR